MFKRGNFGKNSRNISISTFKCTECGETIELPRKNGQAREKGHLKTVYCIKCKKDTKHEEIRKFDIKDIRTLADVMNNPDNNFRG